MDKIPANSNDIVALPSIPFVPELARESGSTNSVPVGRSERIHFMQAYKKSMESLKCDSSLVPYMETNISSLQCARTRSETNLKENSEVVKGPTVTVCETCGDSGFDVALIYCDKCQTYAIHRYCLPKLPKTSDEHVVWLCVDCEPDVQRQSSPSLQLLENLEKDETKRTTSLAVGRRSSNKKDRLNEAETPSSNTCTHSTGSDRFNINEGAESVDNRTSLVAINGHLNITEHILDTECREPDRLCSDKADSRSSVEKYTENSNKKIDGDRTVVDDTSVPSAMSPMCLVEVLRIPSPQQMTNPSEARGKCMSENQPPPTVGFQGGELSVEGQDEGMRPCTTKGVGSQSISASVSHMFHFHIFDGLNSEGISPAGKFGKPVQGCLVKPSLVSTLDAIIKKHGDIAQDCQASGVLLTHALERVCEAVKDLEALPLKNLDGSFLRSLDSTISDAELLKLNVAWFRERYDELMETVSGLLQYKKLKVDIKDYSAMIESEQKAIELERTEVMKLRSRIQSREIKVASMAAKADEMNKAESSIISNFKKFHRKSLVNGLI